MLIDPLNISSTPVAIYESPEIKKKGGFSLPEKHLSDIKK
jgi:hypothetical protein